MKFNIKVQDLTKREDEICDIICKGNKFIGEQLGITAGTVQKHIHNILEKLQVESRLQIAVMITRRRT